MTQLILQSRESSLRLAVEGRRTLEEDLGDFLGDAGEVLGGATHEPGLTISFRLKEGVDAEAWLPKLRGFFQRWDAPRDAWLTVPPDGRRVSVFDAGA